MKALWFGDTVYGWLWTAGFDNDETNGQLTPRPEVDENSPTPFETKTGDE